jgi:hypothetical protein
MFTTCMKALRAVHLSPYVWEDCAMESPFEANNSHTHRVPSLTLPYTTLKAGPSVFKGRPLFTGES